MAVGPRGAAATDAGGDAAARDVEQPWVRPRPDRPALLRDVLAGLLGAAVCVLGLELTRAASPLALPDTAPGRVEDVLWTALVALPLCVRRALPVPAMLVSAGAFIALGERIPVSATTFTLNLALFLVLLSATAWGRHRRRVAVAWVVVLVGMGTWYLAALLGAGVGGLPVSGAALVTLTTLVNVLYFSGALLGGRALWRAARDRADLQRTTERLRVEQERTARQAVVQERLRIARELHDVVAHHVSTTGVQAAGARRVLERSGEGERLAAAVTALRSVEETSRSAVAEMRALLGVLRSDPADDPAADPSDDHPSEGAALRGAPAPQPGLDDLPRLVEAVRAAGVDVSLAVVGTPQPVGAVTSTSLHRLVQEALANVARHSAAGAARVVVRWPEQPEQPERLGAPRRVEVEVLDDGPARPGGGGSGLGHVGMRERAVLGGGEIEVGPRSVGGYRVRARYPLSTPGADGAAATAGVGTAATAEVPS